MKIVFILKTGQFEGIRQCIGRIHVTVKADLIHPIENEDLMITMTRVRGEASCRKIPDDLGGSSVGLNGFVGMVDEGSIFCQGIEFTISDN